MCWAGRVKGGREGNECWADWMSVLGWVGECVGLDGWVCWAS